MNKQYTYYCNVPLILKVREIIFFTGKIPHYKFCPRQNNNPLHFQNQRYVGIFMSLRERERGGESEGERDKKKELLTLTLGDVADGRS